MDMSRGVSVLALDEQLDAAVGFGFHHHGSSPGLWCDSRRPAAAPVSSFGVAEQDQDDIADSLAHNPFTWLQPCGLPLSDVEIEPSISKILEDLPDISKETLFPADNTTSPQSKATAMPPGSSPLSASDVLQIPPQTHFPTSESFVGKSANLTHDQMLSYDPIPTHVAPAAHHGGLGPHSKTSLPTSDDCKSQSSGYVGIEDAIVPTTGRCDDRHPEDSSARAHKRTKITAATVDHLQQRPKKMAEPKLEGFVKRTRWSRPTDQAEHILRERHRRDDMTVKYSILESLLPAGSKRDRATIVEDAIKFVKDLQHRRDKLLKRCSRMKPAVAPDPPPTRDIHMQTVMLQFTMPAIKHSRVGDSSSPSSLSMQESPGSESIITRDCYVHSDLLNEIMIEMMCKPRPNFQSILLQAVESQNLELIRCTVTKTPIGMICIIVAKQQNYPGSPHSHASIIQALKAAVQVV
ncbi:unnamed protein product [Sphagnum troendelagicum]|uniref:BHLH domain-containing protein n=1 Tax=Sphagnum troendelagicum TaxID=128251 RepID=A0ABP0TI34_9BRYO